MFCAGAPLDRGSAFWAPVLGEPVPEHVELQLASTLPHLARWGCADVEAKGEVYGISFEQLRYCALDRVLASVSVHLEGSNANRNAILKFCEGAAAVAEVTRRGDRELVSCEIDTDGESISADFAEGESLPRGLSLYREGVELREDFYRYSARNPL